MDCTINYTLTTQHNKRGCSCCVLIDMNDTFIDKALANMSWDNEIRKKEALWENKSEPLLLRHLHPIMLIALKRADGVQVHQRGFIEVGVGGAVKMVGWKGCWLADIDSLGSCLQCVVNNIFCVIPQCKVFLTYRNRAKGVGREMIYFLSWLQHSQFFGRPQTWCKIHFSLFLT